MMHAPADGYCSSAVSTSFPSRAKGFRFVERRRNISYLKPERSCRRVNRLVRGAGNDYFVGAVSYRAHCDENPRRAARGQVKAVFRAVRFRAFLFAFKDSPRRILQIVRKSSSVTSYFALEKADYRPCRSARAYGSARDFCDVFADFVVQRFHNPYYILFSRVCLNKSQVKFENPCKFRGGVVI